MVRTWLFENVAGERRTSRQLLLYQIPHEQEKGPRRIFRESINRISAKSVPVNLGMLLPVVECTANCPGPIAVPKQAS